MHAWLEEHAHGRWQAQALVHGEQACRTCVWRACACCAPAFALSPEASAAWLNGRCRRADRACVCCTAAMLRSTSTRTSGSRSGRCSRRVASCALT